MKITTKFGDFFQDAKVTVITKFGDFQGEFIHVPGTEYTNYFNIRIKGEKAITNKDGKILGWRENKAKIQSIPSVNIIEVKAS